jgi:hypothetical protein
MSNADALALLDRMVLRAMRAAVPVRHATFVVRAASGAVV